MGPRFASSHIPIGSKITGLWFFSNGCLLPNNSYSCGCLCLWEAFSGQQNKSIRWVKGKSKKNLKDSSQEYISIISKSQFHNTNFQTPNYQKHCTKHLTIPLPQPSPPLALLWSPFEILSCKIQNGFSQFLLLFVQNFCFISLFLENGYAFRGYGQMAKIMQKRSLNHCICHS